MNHREYVRRHLRDIDSWLQIKQQCGQEAAEECLYYFSVPSVWAWWIAFMGCKNGVG